MVSPGDASAAPTERRRTTRATAAAVALVALACAQPFLGFLSHNRDQIHDVGAVLTYAAATVVICVGVLLLLLRRDRAAPATSATLVTVLVVSFFSFSSWLSPYPSADGRLVQAGVWLLVTALAMRLASMLVRRHPATFGYLLVFVAVNALVPTVALVRAEVSDAGPDAALAEADLEIPIAPIEGTAPNVYWFVIDEYGRADQLAAVYGIDNEPFVDALSERGFDVAERSWASYPRTHLSLATTLSMDYTVVPGTPLVDEYTEVSPIVRGDNAVVQRFRDHGYRYLYSDDHFQEWRACDPALADVCLPYAQTGTPLREVDLKLLQLTPIGPFVQPGFTYTDPVQIVDALEAHTGDAADPAFVFAHVMTPHWPYRFEEDCSDRGELLDHLRLTIEQRKGAYATDLRCMNALILEGVDRLVARDPTAIIIVQADHGSGLDLPWLEDPAAWTPAHRAERYSPLNAIRLPDRCSSHRIEDQPLVNTFRIVFACLEGQQIPLLPWRAFLSPYDQVHDIVELDTAAIAGAAG